MVASEEERKTEREGPLKPPPDEIGSRLEGADLSLPSAARPMFEGHGLARQSSSAESPRGAAGEQREPVDAHAGVQLSS